MKAGGTDYLLAPMRKAELAVLDEVLDQAVRAVEAVLTKGVSAAMNEFNRKVRTRKSKSSKHAPNLPHRTSTPAWKHNSKRCGAEPRRKKQI